MGSTQHSVTATAWLDQSGPLEDCSSLAHSACLLGWRVEERYWCVTPAECGQRGQLNAAQAPHPSSKLAQPTLPYSNLETLACM